MGRLPTKLTDCWVMMSIYITKKALSFKKPRNTLQCMCTELQKNFIWSVPHGITGKEFYMQIKVQFPSGVMIYSWWILKFWEGSSNLLSCSSQIHQMSFNCLSCCKAQVSKVIHTQRMRSFPSLHLSVPIHNWNIVLLPCLGYSVMWFGIH